jgi:hypothetical protein
MTDRRPGTNHFRPKPKIEINGFILVGALAILDVTLIVIVFLDAWRIWGPK